MDRGYAEKAPPRGGPAHEGATGRQLPRHRVEVVRDRDPWRRANELFYLRGWTDGLPIVPPTIARVEQMTERSGLPRDQVVAELEPLKGLATVEKIAVNAVMAGCPPEYIPILILLTEAI